MADNDIGIDLGTKSVVIYIKGHGILLHEPSVVAVNIKNGKIIAVGREAFNMVGKTPEYIVAEYPLDKGVISNHYLAQEMVKFFVNKASKNISIKPRVGICVPSSITEVEAMAVVESAKSSGARQVFLVDEPVAAAIGSGIDITRPNGNLIVDIGGGTTDVAVISLNGIVKAISIKIAGNNYDEVIIKTVKNKYALHIGQKTAEEIKKKIVNTYEVDNVESLEVRGKSIYTRLPIKKIVYQKDFLNPIQDISMKIIDAIKQSLEEISPELVGDVYTNGILLTGGGGLLKGMPELIKKHIKTDCRVSDNALECVAIGTGKALEISHLLQEGFKEIK
ncbi:MAG: rod shape-determining protein [Oscillospiraceae bacterium]